MQLSSQRSHQLNFSLFFNVILNEHNTGFVRLDISALEIYAVMLCEFCRYFCCSLVIYWFMKHCHTSRFLWTESRYLIQACNYSVTWQYCAAPLSQVIKNILYLKIQVTLFGNLLLYIFLATCNTQTGI